MALAAVKYDPFMIVGIRGQAYLLANIPLKTAAGDCAVREALRSVTHWQLTWDSGLSPGGALTVHVRPDILSNEEIPLPNHIALYVQIPPCGEGYVRRRAEMLYQTVYEDLSPYR